MAAYGTVIGCPLTSYRIVTESGMIPGSVSNSISMSTCAALNVASLGLTEVGFIEGQGNQMLDTIRGLWFLHGVIRVLHTDLF